MTDRMFTPFNMMLDWTQGLIDIWFGPTPVALRRGITADADAIARLHAANFAHGWQAQTIEQMLADRSVDGFVVETSGRIAGFILLRRVAEEAELLSVAVDAGRRRRGLGRRLIGAGIDALVREQISTLFLEVDAENSGAVKLYRTLGFEEVGRRKGYYRSATGPKDALTMRLDLSRQPLMPPVLDG